MNAPRIVERVESGAGRREMPLPVASGYRLAELVPRRPRSTGYRVPGDMGDALAGAFDRLLEIVERGYGTLSVSPPARLLTPRWLRVVNHLARRGFARTLTLSLPTERGVPIYYFDLEAELLGHESDGAHPGNTRFCRGCSEDYDSALAKVVGECLERTTLLYYRQAGLVRASARALRARGMPFVEPRAVSVFAPWQVERRPELAVDDDAIFGWERVTSLLSSDETLVPAQLVYWNYALGHSDRPEPLLREQNTNGAGGHYSPQAAILSGLLECVQRDGFFRRWLRREPPRRIDTGGLRRPATTALVRSARDAGLEPTFLDYTSTLGVPTCLCVLRRADDLLPHASAGASCRLDGETAMHDALLEAASVHHVLAQSSERLRLPEGYAPFFDPTFTTRRRIAYWANPEHAANLDWMRGDADESVTDFCRGIAPGMDAGASLTFVAAALRRHGFDAWYFLARHPVLGELGYSVARVLVPGLLPMFCEQRNAPLGHASFAGLGPESFPPLPHPFP